MAQNVILTVHILACIALTIVILLQRSEGGALGIGGGGGGGGLMSGRAAVSALVRTTMIFGGLFMLTTLGLTALANKGAPEGSEVTREFEAQQEALELEVPSDPSETNIIDPIEVPAPEDTPAPESTPAPEEPVENPG